VQLVEAVVLRLPPLCASAVRASALGFVSFFVFLELFFFSLPVW